MRPATPSTSRARSPLGRPTWLALALALGLTAAGCGNGDQGAAGGGERPAAGGAGSGEVATLRELTPGDRACYVQFDDAQGQRQTGEAAFPLCERPELVGRRVQLRRERTGIAAASCQGDPECTRQDTVELIVAAEPMP